MSGKEVTPAERIRAWIAEREKRTFCDGSGMIEWSELPGETPVTHEDYLAALKALEKSTEHFNRILKKNPNLVARAEAADMACEFRLVARVALAAMADALGGENG